MIEFKTNDINLASYLMMYYPLLRCDVSSSNRVTFCFLKTPQLQQRVFLFFSKQAECNIASFCDNYRALKAYMVNL